MIERTVLAVVRFDCIWPRGTARVGTIGFSMVAVCYPMSLKSLVVKVADAVRTRLPGRELPDEPTEEGTERDGVLSYAAEWHSLTLGVYHGMRSWRLKPSEMPKNPDVQAEPHYYAGGYVIGTFAQVAVVIVAGRSLLGL